MARRPHRRTQTCGKDAQLRGMTPAHIAATPGESTTEDVGCAQQGAARRGPGAPQPNVRHLPDAKHPHPRAAGLAGCSAPPSATCAIASPARPCNSESAEEPPRHPGPSPHRHHISPKTAPSARTATPTAPPRPNQKIWAFTRGDRGREREKTYHDGAPEKVDDPQRRRRRRDRPAGLGFLPVVDPHHQLPGQIENRRHRPQI
jgi:hypothetical protein